MAEFNITKDDRLPSLVGVCVDFEGNIVDLSAAVSVKFQMRLQESETWKVDAAATISDAAGGELTYAWAAVDVDTSGEYLGRFLVTFAGSKTQSFPNPHRINVHVVNP